MPTITLHAGGYEATFSPAVGGACIMLKKGSHEIFHHYETMEEISAKPTSYGLPLLFPPNRLDGGSFVFEGETIQFEKNEPARGNSLHGFLHTRPWQVEGYSEDEDCAEIHLVFEADEDTDFFQYFPFVFEAEQIYTLDKDGLHQEVRITNLDERKMPLGLGWHSAFAIDPAHGMKVQVNLGKHVQLSDRMLPTGTLLDLDEQEVKFTQEGQDPLYRPLDDLFTVGEMLVDGKPFHGAIFTDAVTGEQVVYEVDDFYKHWVIWNFNQQGSFVCVEPQNWRTNAPNLPIPAEESGFMSLEPQETRSIKANVYMK